MSASEEYNQKLVIGATTAVLLLGTASYPLRLYSRRLSGSRLWYDDYLMAVGMLFALGPCISSYVGLRYGLGKHVINIPNQDPANYLICLYILLLSWMCASTTIKFAILLFYWRLFPGQRFRWALVAVGCFNFVCFIWGFVGFVMQCLPVSAFWQPHAPSHCLDQVPYYICVATFSIVSNVAILLLPMPIVWRLNISRSRKSGLVVVFLLGGIVNIMGIGLVASLPRINPADITYSNVSSALWTSAECQIAILSANLPSMRPLFARCFNRPRTTSCSAKSENQYLPAGSNSAPKITAAGFARMPDRLSFSATEGSLPPDGKIALAPETHELDPMKQKHGIAVRTDVEQTFETHGSLELNKPAYAEDW